VRSQSRRSTVLRIDAGEEVVVKFVLEVDLDEGTLSFAPEEELSRILRYWAGNVRHYPLAVGTGDRVSDSSYNPVGSWRIAD
jgi:hypothetical protein